MTRRPSASETSWPSSQRGAKYDEVERCSRDRCADQRAQLWQWQCDLGELDNAGELGITNRQIVRAEDELGERLQKHHEPERREDLGSHRACEHATDQQIIDADAEAEHRDRDERQRHDRIDAPSDVADVACVHREHQELTVREVDDVHQPVDQREADRDQREHEAHAEAAYGELQEQLLGLRREQFNLRVQQATGQQKGVSTGQHPPRSA